MEQLERYHGGFVHLSGGLLMVMGTRLATAQSIFSLLLSISGSREGMRLKVMMLDSQRTI